MNASNPDLALEVLEYRVNRISKELENEEDRRVWEKVTDENLDDIAKVLNGEISGFTQKTLEELREDVASFSGEGRLQDAIESALNEVSSSIEEAESAVKERPALEEDMKEVIENKKQILDSLKAEQRLVSLVFYYITSNHSSEARSILLFQEYRKTWNKLNNNLK